MSTHLRLGGRAYAGLLFATLFAIPLVESISSAKAAEPMPHDRMLTPTVRQPKFPLKTRRMLWSDEEIAVARANTEKFPSARDLKQKIVEEADKWVAWSDEALRDLVTSAEVPRAFDLVTAGCPVHGKAIHEKGGTYPWIIDPKIPFKVKCPIGGEQYPSNDYETYYKSGFKIKKGWNTQYVDDGWGWVNPANGERYWFVAHANHWTWYGGTNSVTGALLNLNRAYVLTGDKKYAHKAAVLLYRAAQVYPDMDYERQSRFGLMQAAKGKRYAGGVVNSIWETGLVTGLADAYDNVWETIDGDTVLQKLYGKSGEEIRSFIEANLLEQAIDNYYNGRVRGNFGMHQNALLTLALARQNGENAKYVHDILNTTGKTPSYVGIRYALYDSIFRDGAPFESPGYNAGWVSKLSSVARLLKKSNYDLYALPKLRRLYDAVLDIVNIGKFTPSTGDTGGVYGTVSGLDTAAFQQAYREFGDERYAQWLQAAGAVGDGGFKTYESLFLPPVQVKAQPLEGRILPPQPPRLLAGWGIDMLNNPQDDISIAMYYGLHLGHAHFDRLNLDLFANGRPMMPDFGYPDAKNEFVEGIYTWSSNTIAHNTVTVDAGRQDGNVPGIVRWFATSPFARVMDVDGTGSYTQCSTYRRGLVMVDVGAGQSYYIDIFDVAGGRQHDYSLHGPPGKFEAIGGRWSPPAKGTLAGEDVPLGKIYDDAKLGAPGYKGGYGSYKGSGFQHLKNVQKSLGGDWLAQYSYEKDQTAQLRIRVLPQPNQQIILADARVSPVKFPQLVKFVIARRQATGNDKNLNSRFVSVLEPFKGKSCIEKVERIETADGNTIEGTTAVMVQRSDGLRDLIVYSSDEKPKSLRAGHIDITTDARCAVITLNNASVVQRVFFTGGHSLKIGQKEYRAANPVQGEVVEVDARQNTLKIRLGSVPSGFAAKTLIDQVVHLKNSKRWTPVTIAQASLAGNLLTVKTREELLVGLVHITAIKDSQISTDNDLILAPTYTGRSLTDKNFNEFHTIKSATKNYSGPLRQDIRRQKIR